MRIALWTVQVLLAVAFLLSGAMKATLPYDQLAAQMAWVEAVSPLVVKVVGVAEVLGALGLVLPSLLRIKTGLTPLAAAGLVTVMVLAAGLHAFRAEWGTLAPNFVLGGLAAFVAWGRWKKAPVAPRGQPLQSARA